MAPRRNRHQELVDLLAEEDLLIDDDFTEPKLAQLGISYFVAHLEHAQTAKFFAMCVDCGATGPERNADASQRKFTGDWNTRHAMPNTEGTDGAQRR